MTTFATIGKLTRLLTGVGVKGAFRVCGAKSGH